MNRVDKAVSISQEEFSCSQAMFSSFCEELRLDRDRALKISTEIAFNSVIKLMVVIVLLIQL